MNTPFGKFNVTMYGENKVSVVCHDGVVNHVPMRIEWNLMRSNGEWVSDPKAGLLRLYRKNGRGHGISRNAYDKVSGTLPTLLKEYLTPEIMEEGRQKEREKKIASCREKIEWLENQLAEEKKNLASLGA